MLPCPHVTSSQLAKRNKTHTCWSAASQPPFLFGCRTVVWKHRRWFPPGPIFVFTFRVNSLSFVKLVRKSEEYPWLQNADRKWLDVGVTFKFASPSSPIHSLSACTHAPSLSLALSHLRTLCTHTSRTALFLKGATPLLQQWQLQIQEAHRGGFTEVASVEVFCISSELCWQRLQCRQNSHSLQALQKLDGRFQCFSFQLTEDIPYCYIMLLINVLHFTM